MQHQIADAVRRFVGAPPDVGVGQAIETLLDFRDIVGRDEGARFLQEGERDVVHHKLVYYFMQAIRFRNQDSFRTRAETLLLRSEAQNNLMLSVAGGNDALSEDAYLATVEDAGSVVACAFRTPPRQAVISQAAPDAIECLVEDLRAIYPDLPDVLGPEPGIALFAELWSRRTGVPSVQGRGERLFEIRRPPQLARWPAGRLRIAEQRDLPTAAAWCAGFIAEALPGERTNPEAHAASRITGRSLFLWDDGGPVSMAGWAGKTPRGVRVNFVYTPPEYRARGYATACVAQVTQQLLEQGRAFCCLYADLLNQTANSIYQKIGYRPISNWTSYVLNSRKA